MNEKERKRERERAKEIKEHRWVISKKMLRARRKEKQCVTVTNTNYNKRRIQKLTEVAHILKER
jgi:hypothetical protein